MKINTIRNLKFTFQIKSYEMLEADDEIETFLRISRSQLESTKSTKKNTYENLHSPSYYLRKSSYITKIKII